MTSSNSSKKDKDFPIPKEIRDYYEIELVCIIEKLKRFVKILPIHLQFFELTLVQFKKIILKLILDELEEARKLSPEEKEDLLEFQSKIEAF